MPTNERRRAIQGRCTRARAVRQDWRRGLEGNAAKRAGWGVWRIRGAGMS